MKGAVWTVDDEEYYKRRPPRGVGASASPQSNQSPTLTPQTPSIIDQVSQTFHIFMFNLNFHRLYSILTSKESFSLFHSKVLDFHI